MADSGRESDQISALKTKLISLLNTVINLQSTEPYVIVLSLNFSKALDTLQHDTLLLKFAQLDLPDLTSLNNNHLHVDPASQLAASTYIQHAPTATASLVLLLATNLECAANVSSFQTED